MDCFDFEFMRDVVKGRTTTEAGFPAFLTGAFDWAVLPIPVLSPVPGRESKYQ